MPLPLGIPAVVIVVSIAAATAFGLNQIRLSVRDVTEVFTSEKSALNNIVVQAVIGAVAVYILTKFWKGK